LITAGPDFIQQLKTDDNSWVHPKDSSVSCPAIQLPEQSLLCCSFSSAKSPDRILKFELANSIQMRHELKKSIMYRYDTQNFDTQYSGASQSSLSITMVDAMSDRSLPVFSSENLPDTHNQTPKSTSKLNPMHPLKIQTASALSTPAITMFHSETSPSRWPSRSSPWHQAMLTTDSDYRIQITNELLCQLLGKAKEEILGRVVFSLMDPSYALKQKHLMDSLIKETQNEEERVLQCGKIVKN
jgi:PAS domain-containing protein